MGFGNIGWFQILVVLLIVLLIFGTKRIRHLGSDLGGAIREFRKGVNDDDNAEDAEDETAKADTGNSPKSQDSDDKNPG